MISKLTIRQLELFLALSVTPHLGNVSKQVHLSQSAISTAIKNLEITLETKLFDRSNRKLTLNENGRLFFSQVEPLLKQIQWCENIFRDAQLRGSLRIGVSSSIANSILPRMLYRFVELHEGVEFKTETGNTEMIVNLIENSRVDIGFIEGEHHSVDIEEEVFGTDELFIVTGDKLLARDKVYRIAELMDKRWILREKGSGTREVFLKHLGPLTRELNVFMQIDDTSGVKSVLRNSDTLACISRSTVESELAHESLYRVRIKDMKFTRPFYIILHKKKYIGGLLNEFLNFSRSWDEIE